LAVLNFYGTIFGGFYLELEMISAQLDLENFSCLKYPRIDPVMFRGRGDGSGIDTTLYSGWKSDFPDG